MNVQLKPMEILLANPRGFCAGVDRGSAAWDTGNSGVATV